MSTISSKLWLRRAVAVIGVLVVVALIAPVHAARALTANDGLVAIATENGIEVFDPSGDGADRHVLIPSQPTGPGRFSLHEPAWSPQGDHIVYMRWGSTCDTSPCSYVTMWTANSDGSNAHQISAPGEDADRPAWSPDGRIAYVRSGRSVVVADADGSNSQVISASESLGPGYSIAGRPSWTADGRLVVLVGGTVIGRPKPYIADGDGANLRPLTTTTESAYSSNWQFSGNGLSAYVFYYGQDDVFRVDFTTFDGRHLVPPSGTLESRDDVALSPSGQRAATTWTGFPQEDTTRVSVHDIDLPEIHGVMGISVAGTVNGLDWQPQCTITGTPEADELTGTPGPDLICAGDGDDVIRGMEGNDVIYAGSGNDVVSGQTGRDVIVGEAGNDKLAGNRGGDLINSRDGDSRDVVGAGKHHDVCISDELDVLRSC